MLLNMEKLADKSESKENERCLRTKVSTTAARGIVIEESTLEVPELTQSVTPVDHSQRNAMAEMRLHHSAVRKRHNQGAAPC